MKLLAFHKLGENRGSPRVWLESRRLETLGFAVGSPFVIEVRARGVRLRIAEFGTHRVARRRAAGGMRPIIDVANRTVLAPLAPWREVKIEATAGLIDITPSVRAFAIQRRLLARPPFRTLEIFAGGGTLSAAIASHRDFRLVAGVEIDPRFADVWQAAHHEAVLIQADIRRIHPSEYPRHEVLVAAIPCTSHSLLGRAKKSLRGKPELGESGDLFLCIARWWRLISRWHACSRMCRRSGPHSQGRRSPIICGSSVIISTRRCSIRTKSGMNRRIGVAG